MGGSSDKERKQQTIVIINQLSCTDEYLNFKIPNCEVVVKWKLKKCSSVLVALLRGSSATLITQSCPTAVHNFCFPSISLTSWELIKSHIDMVWSLYIVRSGEEK